MSKNSDAVKRWRKATKQKLIDILGGCCIICGYNKSNNAIEFHHLDPAKKDITWGSFRANIKSLNTILHEMKKCVLLCSNCHKELHDVDCSTRLPENYKMLSDEDIKRLLSKSVQLTKTDLCSICKVPKPEWQITCSRECARLRKDVAFWSDIDLVSLYEKYSAVEIAEQLGCSNATVLKRLKKVVPQTFIDRHTNNRIIRHRKFDPTKEQLEELIKTKSNCEIGRIFGVSETAVRKRCKLLGITRIS